MIRRRFRVTQSENQPDSPGSSIGPDAEDEGLKADYAHIGASVKRAQDRRAYPSSQRPRADDGYRHMPRGWRNTAKGVAVAIALVVGTPAVEDAFFFGADEARQTGIEENYRNPQIQEIRHIGSCALFAVGYRLKAQTAEGDPVELLVCKPPFGDPTIKTVG